MTKPIPQIIPELPATYGGAGWQPRTSSLAEELVQGEIWRPCGVRAEWEPLREVVLHWPGEELNFSTSPDRQLMLARPDLDLIRAQTEGLVAIYERAGIAVQLTNLSELPPANFLFQRDLFWATPQGVVLARPAAQQRAGEERCLAQVLARLGAPVIFHPFGSATFEGADALWLDPATVLLGSGVRSNREAVAQLRALLGGMGVEVLEVPLPSGVQHLLGVVNFLDRDLAVVNGGKVTAQLAGLLTTRGIRQIVLPPDAELTAGLGMNFVTLAPRRLLMPAGCPGIRARFRSEGLEVLEAEISEYRKAAGGIGCLTGVLRRG
ncbi:MAG: amidinotransferase [Desulfobulbaceae bacterium]|nr:amidinotransferase [Desulfobulbaceae bacterium]